ncbi:MAG: helix-turn-helix domain-containing protein [Nocardioides sp.]
MTTSPHNPHAHHHDHRRPVTDPTRSAGDEMLTLQEACTFLRIPEGTLRYWRHLGAGPRSLKIGRHVRYWRTDLILWLTEQTNLPSDRR